MLPEDGRKQLTLQLSSSFRPRRHNGVEVAPQFAHSDLTPPGAVFPWAGRWARGGGVAEGAAWRPVFKLLRRDGAAEAEVGDASYGVWDDIIGTEAECPCREERAGMLRGINVSSSRWCFDEDLGRPRVLTGGVGVGATGVAVGETRSEEGDKVIGGERNEDMDMYGSPKVKGVASLGRSGFTWVAIDGIAGILKA